MRERAGFAMLAVGVLLLTAGAHVSGPGMAPHTPPSGLTPEVARAAGNTSINDDLELNATPPSGTYPPGTTIRAEFRLTVNSSSVPGGLTVYLPQLLASFPAAPAPVEVFLPPRNLTIGVGATVTAAPDSVTLRNSTTFNGTRPATINSQLVSLMASAPFGQDVVTAQWNWSLTTPNGASTFGGWGPAIPPAIHPAQVAILGAVTPRVVVPPASVTACISGPLQGRTFSLHAETVHPFDDFVNNTTRDPVGGPLSLCLSVEIPGTIAPQPILLPIWDYESVTLLLYVLKATVGNNSTLGSALGVTGVWTDYANVGIVAGAVGVGVLTAVVARKEPIGPPKGPSS